MATALVLGSDKVKAIPPDRRWFPVDGAADAQRSRAEDVSVPR